jgi:hypothetical protein
MGLSYDPSTTILQANKIQNESASGAPTLTWGSLTNNASPGSLTITSGQTEFMPFLNIQSGHAFTVNSGGQLLSAGTLTINGTLSVSGILRVL